MEALRAAYSRYKGLKGHPALLAEELPTPLNLRQVTLAFVFLAMLFDQAVFIEYSPNRLVATGQVMFSLESLCSHKGILFTQLNYFSLRGRRALMRTRKRNPRKLV